MTLEEAKEFYFRYHGSSFHMDREEPEKYYCFRSLNPAKETLKKWDEELLEGFFEDFRLDSKQNWAVHAQILQTIQRGNCDREMYLKRLLEEMEKTADSDLFNTTLIIENMAGRNGLMTDGGVCLICRYSDLKEKMNSVMEKIITECERNQNVNERFEKAVDSYRKACLKWNPTALQKNTSVGS